MDRSVIDLVNEQSKSLKRKASAADNRKIDEYLEAVRSIERRFEFAENNSRKLADDRALTDTLKRPQPGIPSNHEEYVKQMLELMALSFGQVQQRFLLSCWITVRVTVTSTLSLE